MKLDEDVKMISAEAPVLFGKACEMFIHELTMRAWVHTEDNKRRTLQRNDIAMAITKYDQFDFLIDIVPRDDIKPATRKDDSSVRMAPDQVSYYFQLAQQQQRRSATTVLTTADTGTTAGCSEWGTDHQCWSTAVTASGDPASATAAAAGRPASTWGYPDCATDHWAQRRDSADPHPPQRAATLAHQVPDDRRHEPAHRDPDRAHPGPGAAARDADPAPPAGLHTARVRRRIGMSRRGRNVEYRRTLDSETVLVTPSKLRYLLFVSLSFIV